MNSRTTAVRIWAHAVISVLRASDAVTGYVLISAQVGSRV